MTFTGDTSGVPRSQSGGTAEPSVSGPDARSRGPRPGEVLELGADAARYEVVRSLGTGGTAEVFLARRLGPAGFARPVALKCILTGLDVDESTRRAFLYEARLASRLRHPNIAEAYDLALVGDRYYLVLEYVDGVTVRAAMRAARALGRPLGEAFCCHVAASVADALHHAHTLADDGKPLGIVHRDVTAVNVMIARSGVVKLLDFGVALAHLEGRERTRTGQFRGTFVYASPEQAACEELDGRSDLFSLGVVLVEMLTGVRVFEGETDIGTMRKIAECSAREVQGATAKLPRDLAAICAKALARRPDDRFQDGEAFSRVLREYLTARRITYAPSDCAEELRSLGLLQLPVAGDVVEQQGGGSRSPSGEGTAAAVATGPTGARRLRLRPMLAAGSATALVLAGMVALVPRAGRRPPAAVPVLPAPAVSAAPERAAPGETTNEAASAPSVSTGTTAGPEEVVRPKRSPVGARPTANPQDVSPAITHRDRAAARTTSAEFVDRATVASPRATLPRGTLVPVKLARALVGPNPGRADAIVSEEVAADGVVLVPKGSTVSCAARPPANGRVPLACDRISTSDRVLTFSGVAVGEGQHVGLRLVDDEIAAGTPFVVYVSAPAALR